MEQPAAKLIVWEPLLRVGKAIFTDRAFGPKNRALLKAAGILVCASLDGRTNPERVQQVKDALEILDC